MVNHVDGVREYFDKKWKFLIYNCWYSLVKCVLFCKGLVLGIEKYRKSLLVFSYNSQFPIFFCVT